MNVVVYFSIEPGPGGAEEPLLSVLVQDTAGRTLAEWADDAGNTSLSMIVHKKLYWCLLRFLELPPRGK